MRHEGREYHVAIQAAHQQCSKCGERFIPASANFAFREKLGVLKKVVSRKI